MLTCEAHGCPSNESTKIDGRDILLFPFPENTAQRRDWFSNCRISENTESDKPLYLCELHFDKSSMTDSKELVPNAVPIAFSEPTDEKKRKAEDVSETESSNVQLKQTKLDDGPSIVTPIMETPCDPPVEKIELKEEKDETEVSSSNKVLNIRTRINDSCQETGKKTYRLTIQIDKVYGKPCPKSKKIKIIQDLLKEYQRSFTLTDNNKAESVQKPESAVCAKGGCKLKKSTYDSKPAFQCEHCDKYYIMKKEQKPADNHCELCSKTFVSPETLLRHTKTHFSCDICGAECSPVIYQKHAGLHFSEDPFRPYKCHQCMKTFELKADALQHYSVAHPAVKLQNTPSSTQQDPPQQDHRCVPCNITFRNEQAYRNHVSFHQKKEGLRHSIGEASSNIFPIVQNPITASQIGILRAVKFSCRVCSMEFDNVGEVDKHTRTHLEEDSDEDRKLPAT